MNKKSILSFALFGFFLITALPIHGAAPSIFRTKADADSYMVDHYNRGCAFYGRNNWKEAASEFERVTYFFSNTETGANAQFYLGVCFFNMEEYDFSNIAFTNYLKSSEHPEYFEDVIYYKYCIAEYFRAGNKRRLFKLRYCPKWATARTMCLKIYDEIILTVPNHEMTAKALYAKGQMLQASEDFREGIDAYQILIRRFPKHELAPQAYLNIAQSYYQQSKYEFQNPDLLALAELNARKFREDYPRDERVQIAENYIAEIKELYAKGLCDLALFYLRLCKPEAAIIYFRSAIEEFPNTRVANFSRNKLIELGYENDEEPSEETVSEVNENVPAMSGENPDETVVPQEN